MNNSFWNALVVKMSHFIHEYNILHQHWTARADRQHSRLVANWCTASCCQLVDTTTLAHKLQFKSRLSKVSK